jgi:2-keto-4-pentenoate hydratase/2-oxohepta-3-ene-1,7-dioic acid hydratase in catechol pathway
MIYCRFSSPTGPQYGLVESVAGEQQITHILPAGESGLPDIGRAQKSAAAPLASASLLAPVQPTKIICVGRNYLDHAKELGNEVPAEPLLFMKPPSSIIATGETILLPEVSQRVEFEAELGVIVGERCRNLRDDEDVTGYIGGYVSANDVTARDLQRKDNQWTRAKGFDTFCPVGPLVNDDLNPWRGVHVESCVNGHVRQSGSTADFIFPLDVVLRYITRIMTLVPGDLILTGTPAGVGPLAAGDVVEVTIEGLGLLKNPVASAV